MLTPEIIAATAYLHRHIQPSGRFNYLYDPINDVVKDEYNFIRHAGTLYALYQVGINLKLTAPAMTYVRNNFIQNDVVFNGFVALMLLAEVEYHNTNYVAGAQHLNFLNEAGKLLLKFQNDKGAFAYSISGPQKTLTYNEFGYYAGQSILALSSLFHLTQNQVYLDAAKKGARFIINRDDAKDLEVLGRDHWICMGMCKLASVTGDEKYLQHARMIKRGILDSKYCQQINNPGETKNFTIGETATRIEGLVSIAMIDSASRDNETLGRIGQLLQFIKPMQYTQQAITKFKLNARALGGFMTSPSKIDIRIDGVQHAISAIYGAEILLRKFKAPPAN